MPLLRIFAALGGVVTVLITALLALELWERRPYTGIADYLTLVICGLLGLFLLMFGASLIVGALRGWP